MCPPPRNLWDPTGTDQSLSAQSMPRPVSVSQEGFRQEERKPRDAGGGGCLEDLGRVITRQWKSAHAPLRAVNRGTGCLWG